MSNINKAAFPFWLASPKMAAISLGAITIYRTFIEPQVREQLKDVRSRLVWWSTIRKRSFIFLSPLLLTAIGVGFYAYNQTQDKNFLYGVIASTLVLPYDFFGFSKKKVLQLKSQDIEKGGFLTKAEERQIDNGLTEWNQKVVGFLVFYATAALFFAIGERNRLNK